MNNRFYCLTRFSSSSLSMTVLRPAIKIDFQLASLSIKICFTDLSFCLPLCFNKILPFPSYKHVFDGLYRIAKEEGFKSLFRGTIPAVTRAILLTIGTNAAYDQVKQVLKGDVGIKEGLPLHFLTSTIAGFIGTIMTQPIDVMKTTYMNAPPGEFRGLADVAVHTMKQGPLAFYKGFVPALLRISPNTIITFMLYEQARLRFGYLPSNDSDSNKKFK